jgi:hypothetical protein
VEAADDILYPPGGPAYRCNVHQVGVINPWPQIDSVTVFLGTGENEFLIGLMHRNYIETRAGEARNNILRLSTSEEGAIMLRDGLSHLALLIARPSTSIVLRKSGKEG